ncbi:MAG: SCO1664 family protein [Chloroflexi bacterium]|nr:SCO1664 family protein [Chloroflexota bacterium]
MDASVSTNQKTDQTAGAVSLERALRLLSQGQVELVGQVLDSSNVIFVTRVDDGDLQSLAIYKPRQGERPLWDFDHGTLCQREMATFVLSQALGWPLVPPTVLRDGPYGPGALQLYIDADYEANYFTFREERLANLLPVALFDILANNADRKGGHLLLDQSNRIWAIDNALTFHAEPKLRTVIWDLSGEAIPEEYLTDLRQLQEELARESTLRQTLGSLLSEDEITALQARLTELLESGKFPHPDPTRRHVPWPMI